MDESSKQPRIHKLSNPLQDSTNSTFFAVVNPGFEIQAQREVEEILLGERVTVVTGGIQFDSTWGAVRLGQPRLKIISRVLVRVDQFGARDFQKLFRKVSNLPWEEWLKPKVGLTVRAASQASRLRIKAGIEESVVEAFKKSFKAPPPRPVQEVLCLVRVEDDICTISLDLSGELLHKRGSHTDVGVAPLRETWAASIVDRAFEIAAADEATKAQFAQKWQWVEPMAGTAVFLREVLSRSPSEYTSAEIPGSAPTAVPEVAREFAIDTCFKLAIDAGLKAKPQANTTRDPIQPFLKTLGEALIVDKDEAQLERGRKALSGLRAPVELKFMTSSKTAKLETKVPRMVFVNPPWGHRLKGKDATDTPESQKHFLATIEAEWKPSLVAVVLPRLPGPDGKRSVAPPKGWTEHLPLEFRAGGIPVRARFFTVKRAPQS